MSFAISLKCACVNVILLALHPEQRFNKTEFRGFKINRIDIVCDGRIGTREGCCLVPSHPVRLQQMQCAQCI